ncbi:hypothetical protein ACXWYY_000199 [Enterobacter hormaechei]
MWHSIYNWPWATIWAAVSAIFTAAAVGVAGWAMFRWRKQDELKVKLAFKQAVSDYAYCLMSLPQMLNNGPVRMKHKETAEKLVDLLNACNIAWLSTEGLLEKETEVAKCWEFIFENHKHFLAGALDRDTLGAHCMGILSEKFVFN